QNWINETSAITANDLFGTAFSDPTTAFICGEAGTILKTVIDISSTPDQTIQAFQCVAFPNPATDQLFLKLELQQTENITIQITDVAGKIMTSRQLEMVAGLQVISLQEELAVLTQGLYFVSVKTQTQQKSMAIVRY
ncbi:MAG: T9SS type A sorting domain-containing protein, partial [Bacteroidia bacterium]